MIPIYCETRQQWLQERQKGIGASDMPALLGVGWDTAQMVYLSKVLPVADYPPKGRMLRGLKLEPLVAAEYSEVMGVTLELVPMFRHAHIDWMLATPDRVRLDGIFVQLKTLESWENDDAMKAWGPNGSDEIPINYRVQVNQEMAVTGTEMIDVAALNVHEWELRVYRLRFDEEIFRRSVSAGNDFWRHILSGEPLSADYDVKHSIRPVYGLAVGKRLDLGQDVADMIERRAMLKNIGKEAEQKADELTAKIEAIMQDAEEATAPGWRIKRSLVSGGQVSYQRKDYHKITITRSKEHE